MGRCRKDGRILVPIRNCTTCMSRVLLRLCCDRKKAHGRVRPKAQTRLPSQISKRDSRPGEEQTQPLSSLNSTQSRSTIRHHSKHVAVQEVRAETDLGPATALKSSVRRVIRQKLTDQYPALAADEGALLEAAWPNKASVTTMKFAREHVQMFIADKQVLFFQHYDDWYLPSLRLLHKCKSRTSSLVIQGSI